MRNPIKNPSGNEPVSWTIWGNLVTGKPSIDHLRTVKDGGSNADGRMVTMWGSVLPLRPGKHARPRSKLPRPSGSLYIPRRGFDTIFERPKGWRPKAKGWKSYSAWFLFKTIWGKVTYKDFSFPWRHPQLCVRDECVATNIFQADGD